jgi:predicted nucleic acid-binding protein
MILADTTIWVDHFHSEIEEMRKQLDHTNVVIHPFVIAELALGSLQERTKTLLWLDLLPQARVAQTGEVRQLVEACSLYCKGIGLIDAHLIASCLITPSTLLWTHDKRLRGIAEQLGIHANLP